VTANAFLRFIDYTPDKNQVHQCAISINSRSDTTKALSEILYKAVGVVAAFVFIGVGA
jgi:hypothetical protein